MKRGLKTLSTMALLAMILLFAPRARAFDTGPHNDLTEEVMRREGFNTSTIQITQVQNWYVDYFSGMKALYPWVEEECAKLHFDNMPTMDMSTTEKLANYWSHLTFNTRAAIHLAVVNHDEIRLLTVIGMSMHAVQDFYSHSNWVECHERMPGAPYRTETWFNSQPAPMSMNLRTGHYPNSVPESPDDHGDYTYGINHDGPGSSISRSRFDEAYFFAFVASLEWIKNCKIWADEIDPSFWAAVQQFKPDAQLADFIKMDKEAAYRLSEWAPSTGGHWKGPGSADLTDFIGFSAGWVPSVTTLKMYVVGLLFAPLTDGLTSDAPAREATNVAPFRMADIMFGVVNLSTDWVEDLSKSLDDVSGADFYPVITIGDQTFKEAMQLDTDAIRPPWTTLKIVDLPAKTIPIHIELWDEDGGVLGNDDAADINPSKLKKTLDFDFDFETHMLSGDVGGLHDTIPVSKSGENGGSGQSLLEFTVNGSSLAPVKTIPNQKMSAGASPSTVSINIKLQLIKGEWVEIDQSVKKLVTVHAVDAVTNQPLQGFVYKDSPYGGSTYMGPTDTAFYYTFSTSGGDHNVGFRVYVPGYDSAVANVWVDVVYPDWY